MNYLKKNIFYFILNVNINIFSIYYHNQRPKLFYHPQLHNYKSGLSYEKPITKKVIEEPTLKIIIIRIRSFWSNIQYFCYFIFQKIFQGIYYFYCLNLKFWNHKKYFGINRIIIITIYCFIIFNIIMIIDQIKYINLIRHIHSAIKTYYIKNDKKKESNKIIPNIISILNLLKIN